ncbi:MAG: DEAD/DEAH box helicase family protein, partial [Alphaproteobacteria bacterium]|nr:DEAD/DEAH box helicase family protein [Alphaproteobacteria bacterium]
MDLNAGLGVAVRSSAGYALFVGADLCGAIEAKPDDSRPAGFAQQTASADTARHPVQHEVRFAYAATCGETLFRDCADPAPRWRRVFAFHRPKTLQRWLADGVTIRRRLGAMPLITTESLRDCQIDAVQAIEASLAAGKLRALIQMAAGAGKTFTACTLSHRLLEHGKFNRILFLADRAHLVRQARDDFLAYHPPGAGRSTTERFDIQTLGPAGIEESATVVISTVERVYAMLTDRELAEDEEEQSAFDVPGNAVERVVSYNPAMPIEMFDLIVIDEAHLIPPGGDGMYLSYFRDAKIINPNVRLIGLT